MGECMVVLPRGTLPVAPAVNWAATSEHRGAPRVKEDGMELNGMALH